MDLLRPFRRRRPPVDVVLHTRAGCGLCDELLAELDRLGLASRYRLREVDVDGDRALKKRHGLRLPVLEVEGEECWAGPVEPAAFRSAFRAALGRARRGTQRRAPR